MDKLAPRHPLPRHPAVDRDQYLLDLCRDQRVLHLACAAWPATQAWCRDGSLLHLRLERVCRKLAGFDISQPGLELMRQYGADNVHLVDVLDADSVAEAWSRLGFVPEVILAGELLEHLDAPGVLLRICRRQMNAGSHLVVTVPNAFSLRSFLHALGGYEKVASDHVAYYSLTNLHELARRSGFELQAVRWYRYSPRRGALDRVVDYVLGPLVWLRPQLSEGIVATMRPFVDPYRGSHAAS